MNNQEKYKEYLNNIKPSDELVNSTISKIKDLEMKKTERRKIVFFKPAMIMAGVVVLTLVSYNSYKIITKDSKEIDKVSSKETYYKNSEKIIKKIKEKVEEEVKEDKKNEVKQADLSEISALNLKKEEFTGMYLIRKIDKDYKWLEYNHTKKYDDYISIYNKIKMVSIGDVSYIESERPESIHYARTENDMMLKINSNYEVIIPDKAGKPIIVKLLYTDKLCFYKIHTDGHKQTELDYLRLMIKKTGTNIIEDEPESVDRNQGVIINGEKHDDVYIDYIAEFKHDIATVKLKSNNKLVVTFNEEAYKKDKYVPTNQKIEFNKEYIISEDIISVESSYIGQENFPVIVYVSKLGRVYYIRLEDIMIYGDTNRREYAYTDIIDVVDVNRETDSNGYTIFVATKKDGTKHVLNLENINK